MTLRTKTLTAVAALTISAAGFALAQDASSTDATTTTEQPADQTPAAPAPEAAEAPAEAVATDTADDTAPAASVAEEQASEDLQPTESADQTATEEEVQDEAAPSTDEAAIEETAAEQDATAGSDAETAVEEESAAAPTDAELPQAEADEAAAEGEVADGEHAADAEGDGAHDAEAAGGHATAHIEDIAFSFEGPFGKYDQFQLQRGLQVFTEVCSACHGMKFVPIRTLADEGGPALPEDQVRAYAANMAEIPDPETGEDRPRLPTDHFPAVSGDGMGPDLSLMAKARAGFHGPYGTGISQLFKGIGGPEYIHAILTGYTGETKEEAGSTFYENHAFSTGWIKMPPPLSDDLVTYEDGTPATVDQMARDMSAFLMWTAEPKMMDRKMVGLVSVLFLIVLTALLYLTNKRIWAPYKGKVDPNA